MPHRRDMDGFIDPLSQQKETDEGALDILFDTTFEDQEKDLLRNLSKTDPQDPGQAWWQKWDTTFLSFFLPFITQMSIESAEGHRADFGVGVSTDLIAAESMNWANTYGFNFVSGINEGTRSALQQGIAGFNSGALDFGGLVDTLAYQLNISNTRAENIAMTETTRAYFQGMRIYRDQVGALGVQTDVIWHAEADACPICLPNHMVAQSSGLWTVPEIPAHPRCRCWPEIIEV